jgi:hypothetical protein
MKTRSIFALASALVLMGAVMSGCNKDKDSTSFLNEELQTLQDDALLESADEDINTFTDQFDAVGEELVMKSGLEVVTDTCPLVTHYRNGDTTIITIDFGSSCIDRNQNARSGKIVITKIGKRKDAGSYRRVSLVNFIINGNKIEGTRTETNLGLNENNNPHFSVVLTGGKLTTADGDVIERNYERDREWITGYDTQTPWDNEYLITGSATGINFNGLSFTRTIMEPLHVKMACRFIVSGVVKTEVEGTDAIVLDYGNGECDNLATLTRGTDTRQIELLMKHRRWAKRHM